MDRLSIPDWLDPSSAVADAAFANPNRRQQRRKPPVRTEDSDPSPADGADSHELDELA